MLAFGMNASAQDAVFAFNEANSYEQFGLAGWSYDDIADGDIIENKSVTSGDVTLTVTPSSGNTATRMYVDSKGNYSLRLYADGQIIIKSNKNIAKISFPDLKAKKPMLVSAGKLNGTEWTADGADINEVAFTATKSTTVYKIEVTLAEGGSVDPEPEPEPEPTPGEVKELYNVTFDSQDAVKTWTKEGFLQNDGDFASFDAGKACMVITAYQGDFMKDWSYAVSPVIKLGENNTVSFTNTTYVVEDGAIALVVRTVGGEWTEITGAKYGDNWKEFINSGDVVVPAEFNNQEVQFGFKYTCNTYGDYGSGALYVKDFKVNGEVAAEPEPQPEENVANNIAELKAFCSEEGLDVTLNLKDAKVLYVNEYDNKDKHTQNVYVKDETGAILFYNLGLVNVTDGAVINGTVKGVAKDYYGTPEFLANTMTDAAALTIVEGELAEPVAKTLANITNDDISDLVKVENLSMISRDEEDNKGKMHTNFYLVDADNNELQIFNKYHVEAFNDLKSFVGKEGLYFSGIINLNWGKLELCPIDGGCVEPEPEPVENVANNIAELKAFCSEEGVDVTLNLTDAKVLYVNEYDNKDKHTQNVYVKDATDAILFYNLGLVNVANGAVINGTVKGAAKDYHGTMEFCTNAETDAAALNIVEGSLAEPVVKNIAEVTNDDISDLVEIDGVSMISKDEEDNKGNMHTNYYLVDAEGNELQIFNKYHVEAYSDFDSMVGQEGLNFMGIINLNWGKLEICPIEGTPTGIENIENAELDANAPMYNVAGQRVDANFKGIILQNGKKFINK